MVASAIELIIAAGTSYCKGAIEWAALLEELADVPIA
jgi:hypothetical protein